MVSSCKNKQVMVVTLSKRVKESRLLCISCGAGCDILAQNLPNGFVFCCQSVSPFGASKFYFMESVSFGLVLKLYLNWYC